MQVKMLLRCSYLKLDHEFIIDPVLFTHNKEIIGKDFSDKQFLLKVGVARMETGFKDTAFGVHSFDFDEADHQSEESLIQHIHFIQRRVDYWLPFFWFACDNSICVPEIFVNIPEKHGSMILDNSLRYTNASGNFHTVTMTKADILETKTYVDKYTEYMQGKSTLTPQDFKVVNSTNERNGVYNSKLNDSPYNQNQRIERAWMFLKFARKAEFMPMKIALYIPFFESLFSSGNISAEKMSKRIYNYLEEVASDKIIYDAHIFRHKYIHGSELREYATNQKQIELSKAVDGIARAVFKKLFLNDLNRYKQNESQLYIWWEILDRK